MYYISTLCMDTVCLLYYTASVFCIKAMCISYITALLTVFFLFLFFGRARQNHLIFYSVEDGGGPFLYQNMKLSTSGFLNKWLDYNDIHIFVVCC